MLYQGAPKILRAKKIRVTKYTTDHISSISEGKNKIKSKLIYKNYECMSIFIWHEKIRFTYPVHLLGKGCFA